MRLEIVEYDDFLRLQNIASIIAAKTEQKVNVIEDGLGPAWYDEKKEIYLARKPLRDILKGTYSNCIKGVLYHECGHALVSDLGTFIALRDNNYLKDKLKKEEKSYIECLMQSMEDVRVERAIAKMFPGVKRELNDFFKRAIRKKETSPVFIKELGDAIYVKERYNKYFKEHKKMATGKIRRIIKKEINKELEQLNKAKDSFDVLKLAGEVYQKIKKYIKESDLEKTKKEVEKDNKGFEGVARSLSNKDDGAKFNPDEKKKLKERIVEIIEKIKEDKELLGRVTTKMVVKGEKVFPKVPAELKDIKPTKGYIIYGEAKLHDKELMYSNKNIYLYRSIEKENKKIYGTMERRLKEVFIQKTRSKLQGGHLSGRTISAKDLWKFGKDDFRIFERRSKQDKKDYAVSLLIDLSGSMVGEKIDHARSSVILFSDVLDKLSVQFEILGFTSLRSYCGCDVTKYEEIRYDALVHYIFKNFDDRYDDNVKARLGGIDTGVQNWDGEAILWAYNRLKINNAANKILIVLSDGEPCGHSSVSGNLGFTQQVCQRVQKRVKLIGIGYMDDTVKEIYKNYVIVKNVVELSNEFLILIRKLLLRG